MASPLGSFTSGLMAGQEHADKRRRNRAIDELLDRDAYEKDLGFEMRRRKYEAEGGDLSEFPEYQSPTQQDPYLVRGFNWLKNKFGFGAEQAAENQTAGVTPELTAEDVEPRGRGALPAGQFYADGGRVRDPDYTAMDSLDVRGGYRSQSSREADKNLAPREVDKEPIFPRARAVNEGYQKSNEAIRAALPEDATMQQRGNAAGRQVGNALVGGLSTVVAAGRDMVDNIIPDSAADYVKGFIGFDGTRDSRQPDPDTPPPSLPEKPAAKKAAIDEAVGDQKSSEQIAADAVQKGVEMTPGHPDNPDQAFDWAEVSASGVRPEDIPNMTVKDWTEYRRQMAQAAAMGGEDPTKVHEQITKMQMQGAQSNLMQAAFLLRSGDARGAALAARAAFQYFPNGSDVRFGVYDSADGPVLVGMGVDEETGEPIKEGKPMILNPEAISAMSANFSDPTAFMTWTKDWRDEEFQRRKYHEVEKPQAEAELGLTDAKTDYYRSGALANQAEAAGGRGGGLKQSDYDRAFAAFKEEMDKRGTALEDPRLADQLAADMTTLYRQLGGRLGYTEIMNVVMGVNNGEYTLAEGLRQYGIDVGQ